MDRRSLAALTTLAASLAGCPGEKDHPAAAPGPAAFQHVSAVHGAAPWGEIFVLADRPDLCAEIAAHPCGFHAADGALLLLTTDTAAAGTYAVPDACDAYFTAHAARLEISSADATGGTVTLEAAALDGSIAGAYALAFPSDAASGAFTAEGCDALAAAVATPTECGSTTTGLQFDETCTCQRQTALRSCTRAVGATTWSCTCTASSGAQTTCSAPDAGGEPDTDCCPVGFD